MFIRCQGEFYDDGPELSLLAEHEALLCIESVKAFYITDERVESIATRASHRVGRPLPSAGGRAAQPGAQDLPTRSNLRFLVGHAGSFLPRPDALVALPAGAGSDLHSMFDRVVVWIGRANTAAGHFDAFGGDMGRDRIVASTASTRVCNPQAYFSLRHSGRSCSQGDTFEMSSHSSVW